MRTSDEPNQNMLPTIFIIVGATSDLFLKKVAPALLSLYQNNKLPKLFQIIGFARRPFSDKQFRKLITDDLKKNPKATASKKVIDGFLKMVFYHQGNFSDMTSYQQLGQRLGMIDGQWKACSNKLFYLSVGPDLYKPILEQLDNSGIAEACSPQEGWTRVIIEKPFGKDQKTAQELDMMLAKRYQEPQIYRIDHYLGKELLQNILAFQFSNILFSDSWNNKSIEQIDIRLLEKHGVETRGDFYDNVGALRDVGQNHLLQMLTLVTMENPLEFKAEPIRQKRLELLQAIKTPSARDIKESVREQYNGYRKVEGVAKNSQTETYFKIKLAIDKPQWQGVPIYLEGGKNQAETKKEIEVTFREMKPCLCPGKTNYTNKIIFSLEPVEKISITFWTLKPGLSFDLEERSFEFKLHDALKKHQHVSEYERLLHDCIAGDQTLFVSTDEIKQMWRIIDPIVDGWRANLKKLTEN